MGWRMTARTTRRASARSSSGVLPTSRDIETMPTGETPSRMTTEEAAALILNGAMVAVGGLTPAGAPKVVPRAPARLARVLHRAGTAFQQKLLRSASTGTACDDGLARTETTSSRAPCMTSAPVPEPASAGKLEFVDMHPFLDLSERTGHRSSSGRRSGQRATVGDLICRERRYRPLSIGHAQVE